jgi:hypothetical protein
LTSEMSETRELTVEVVALSNGGAIFERKQANTVVRRRILTIETLVPDDGRVQSGQLKARQTRALRAVGVLTGMDSGGDFPTVEHLPSEKSCGRLL